MGEVKRYVPQRGRVHTASGWKDGAIMVESGDGIGWLSPDDYARLEREYAAAQAELTRLRAVEAEVTQLKHDLALSKILHHAAELKMREEHGHHMRTIEGVRNLLAEACGRKGCDA